MRFLVLGLLVVLMIPAGSSAQGLFESTGTGPQSQGLPFLLNGYGRGVLYLGEHAPPSGSEIRSGYGEAALKISALNGSRARMYSELRFRSGYEYDRWIQEFSVREAYAELYLGKFELLAGQAIAAWGRADAFNPTNNLTPQDYFVRSPGPDDMRLGNFLLRARYRVAGKVRLEATWVPRYRYSVYRFELFNMPSYVRFSESPLPGATLQNGAVGLKMDLLFDRFDGSLSWFSGFDPMPGIQPGDITGDQAGDLAVEMYARAFRQQTLGLDFSCGLGSFGVRGEAAFRNPSAGFRDQVFAPGPDLRYVLEAERSFGNLTLMAMYMGQFVFDYVEIPEAAGMPEIDLQLFQDPTVWSMMEPILQQQTASFNRIIFDQTEKWSHTLALRPALSIFYDVVNLELFGLYNLTTREWGLMPGLAWAVTDALKISLGGQYFEGPENTRFELIAPVFKGGYLEMKYNF